MRFGFFDDQSREYVITTPETPYPWINYLGSEKFFALVSHQAGGYCFYRDARLRRLLRYRYNNAPTDVGGRYFYVREADGSFWTPSYLPVKAALDTFECRHGLGYTKITGERKGLSVETTFLVPLGHTAEVHRVKVKNTGSTPRTFKLFSYLEFCLWNAYDDMTNYQRNFSTGEVEVEPGTIYHKTEYRERRDHFAFSHVNASPAELCGFDTDRETFMGLYNGMHEPQVVARGESGNSVASGWAPIASHCLAVTLAPGEEKTFVFTLGYVENPRDEKWEKAGPDGGSPQTPGVINKTRARELIAAFSTAEQVEAALAALADYWSANLAHYQVRSPDEKLDRMVNIWNAYQCMATFNMSRSRLVLRVGHRPRPGLSRLQPGPARLCAHGARRAPASASSTWPPPSSPTAAPITSTSRSPSAATTTSAAASTTIRSGSSSASRRI